MCIPQSPSLLSLGASLVVAGVALAQERPTEAQRRTTAVLERAFAATHAPVSAIVAMRGQPVATWSQGTDATGREVAGDSLFAAGAVTETITAIALLRLLQEGKISLDRSIEHYLHDVPRSAQRITVRHLLLHSTGLPAAFDLDSRGDDDLDAFTAAALRLAPGVRPGGFVQYSQLDFALAAALAERVIGEPLAPHCERTIFKPAGIDGMGFASGDLDRRRFVRADGHQPILAAEQGRSARGAVDLVASTNGLLQLYRALRERLLLDDRNHERLLEVQTDDRTFAGYAELDANGRFVRLRAQGSIGAFRACWSWDPTADRCVALLAASGDAVDLVHVERALIQEFDRPDGGDTLTADAALTAKFEPYTGHYRLDTDNGLEIVVRGDELLLCSIGQTASARLAHGQPTLPEWPTFYAEVEQRAPVLLRPMLQKDTESFARSFYDRADPASAANGVRLVETLEQELGAVGQHTLVGTSGANGLQSWFRVEFGETRVSLRITWHGERFASIVRDPEPLPFRVPLTAAGKHRFKARSLDGNADLEVRFQGVGRNKPARGLVLYDASKSGRRGLRARRKP